MVGLHQRADRPPTALGLHHPRRRADAALELVANHPRAAADVALSHRPAGQITHGRVKMFGLQVETIHIVEPAVPRLADDGQAALLGVAVLLGIGDERLVDRSHVVGAGQGDGVAQLARLIDPQEAGHLATAVEGVVGGEGRVAPDVAGAGHDDRHPGAGHARRVVDDGGVADQRPGHVGNSVVAAGREFADGDAQIAQSCHTSLQIIDPPIGQIPKTSRQKEVLFASALRSSREALFSSSCSLCPIYG